jgi:hypothetical protein
MYPKMLYKANGVIESLERLSEIWRGGIEGHIATKTVNKVEEEVEALEAGFVSDPVALVTSAAAPAEKPAKKAKDESNL